MEKMKLQKWYSEIVWLIVSIILAVAVLLPIKTSVPDYPFYAYNLIYVFGAVHFTRYIFLLKYTPFSHSKWFKLIVIFTAIPAIVLLIDGMAEFQAEWDYTGFQEFLGHLRPDKHNALSRYIRSEFIFLGVTTVISAIILPIRMIISLWRVRNRNTV